MKTILRLKNAVVEYGPWQGTYIVLTRMGPGDWDDTTFYDRRDAIEYARSMNRQLKAEGRGA